MASGGDDGAGKRERTPKYDIHFVRKRGPAWYGLRRSTQVELRMTLGAVRTIRSGLLGLGVVGAVTVYSISSTWGNRVDNVIDLADKKLPNYKRKSEDPDK